MSRNFLSSSATRKECRAGNVVNGVNGAVQDRNRFNLYLFINNQLVLL